MNDKPKVFGPTYKIFKYILFPGVPGDPWFRVNIPAPAEVLSVEEQNGNIVVYAKIEEGAKTVDTDFAIVGTGHPLVAGILKAGTKFLGTVKLNDGVFMFHIFYRQELIRV